MAESPELHSRLIARQSDAELERKWKKAQGRHSNRFWTQECLDVAGREADRLILYFKRGAKKEQDDGE
jgi:hypothetical protein